MATLTATYPRLVAGPIMETTKVLIKSGQTWNPGQFLRVDTSGLLVAAASNASAANGGIQYFSLTTQTDPGVSTTLAEVGIIHQDHVFEMNELNGTVTTSNIGNHYALDVSSNIGTLDVDDTSNDCFEVVNVGSEYNPLQNTAADVKGRARVKILPAVINAARTA